MTGSTAARRLHLALDRRGHAALLAWGVDLELVVGRRIVAAIAGIGEEPLDVVADELLRSPG